MLYERSMELHFVHHKIFVFLGTPSNIMKQIQCETCLIIRKKLNYILKQILQIQLHICGIQMKRYEAINGQIKDINNGHKLNNW